MLSEKRLPVPSRAEVLVRIDAVAICATDLEIIHSGSPASIGAGLIHEVSRWSFRFGRPRF
ncbi:MAG: alcohol dehydrogenase catalytic domain-containing protein, partial [Bradyrhizobium sp.]